MIKGAFGERERTMEGVRYVIEGGITMGDAREEKQAILKQMEYSVEISNPLGGTFWDNIEYPLSGKYNEIYEYREWFDGKD